MSATKMSRHEHQSVPERKAGPEMELWWVAPLVFAVSSLLYVPYLEGNLVEEFSIVASTEHLLKTGEYRVQGELRS